MKKGVEVRVCGKEMVPDFARIMLTTGVRDGFVTRPPEYFANMLDNLGEHARLYMAFHEGQPIAGTLAIHYGDKVWYLYGASSSIFERVTRRQTLRTANKKIHSVNAHTKAIPIGSIKNTSAPVYDAKVHSVLILFCAN